jgi:hypothetical protein
MIPDLAADPIAVRTSPVRGTPQPILPKTPLTGNGTTSSGATGGGGYNERTYESRQRRADMAAVTAPTPRQALATFWETYERSWERRIQESKDRQRNEMRERIRQDEIQTQQRIELLRKQTEFKKQEILVESVIQSHSLSHAERAAVHQRLLDSGTPLSLEIAEMACQQVVLERGTTPVQPSDTGFDWRGALKK